MWIPTSHQQPPLHHIPPKYVSKSNKINEQKMTNNKKKEKTEDESIVADMLVGIFDRRHLHSLPMV